MRRPRPGLRHETVAQILERPEPRIPVDCQRNSLSERHSLSGRWRGGVLSEGFPVQLAALRPGSLLAGYRLEAQIGSGGMAVVFRARDERLGRLVALKVLAQALAADSTFQRRFMAESRAASAVDDPHIIPIYEADEANGVLFIAMRFVPGGDLGGVLEREGPLAPARTLAFIAPVASALDAAHGACSAPGRQTSQHPGRCQARQARACVPVGLRGEQGCCVLDQPDRGRTFRGYPELFGAGADPGLGCGWTDRSIRTGLRDLSAANRVGAVWARPGHGSAVRAPVSAAPILDVPAAGPALRRRPGAG